MQQFNILQLEIFATTQNHDNLITGDNYDQKMQNSYKRFEILSNN